MKSGDHPSFALFVANLVAGLTSTLNRWGEKGRNGVKMGEQGLSTGVVPPGNTSTPAGCCSWASCWIWLMGPWPGSSMPALRWVSASPQPRGDPWGVPRARCPPGPCPSLPPQAPSWMTSRISPRSGWARRCCCSPRGCWGGLLTLAYVLAVFARLCFFSSGKMSPDRGGAWGCCPPH